MDFKHGKAWAFVLPDVKDDGVYVAVRVGRGTLMEAGNIRKRAELSIATLGPFSAEEEALEAGRAAAIEWIDANPGYPR